jgi:hypothetical protein
MVEELGIAPAPGEQRAAEPVASQAQVRVVDD